MKEKKYQFTETKTRKIIFNEITFIIAIIGFVLSAFIYLTSPTNDNNTALQLQDQRITAQRETIDKLTLTQQNDTQELKEVVKDLVDQIQLQQQDITRLSTILEERLPKKQ